MLRRAILIALVWLCVACQRPPETVVRVETVTVMDTVCLVALNEQRVLIKLAELQMVRYARIVQRDPTQRVFLVGWTHRAFAGVLPDSAP